MTTETARKINAAACSAWLFQQGVLGRIGKGDVRLLQSLSVAQIQTAIDIIEAVNRDAPSIRGVRTFSAHVDCQSVDQLKRYADSLAV
ncbi:MAG: hypothetical protein PHE83_17580 [Opitutaceae bacterium]|nr:hypothetical protein [Opitutaceae bacterium]